MQTLEQNIILLAECQKKTSLDMRDIVGSVARLHKSQLTFKTELNDEIVLIKMQLDFLQNKVVRFEEFEKNILRVCIGLFVICLFLLSKFFSQ